MARKAKASAHMHFRDEAQLTKLQQLGMTTVDESKLQAMRDFIWKLARNIARWVLFE